MNQAMEDPVRTDLSEFGYIEKKMAAAGLLYIELCIKAIWAYDKEIEDWTEVDTTDSNYSDIVDLNVSSAR
jgi:hypothetical protein